jgi:hypothetical protein
MDFATIWWLFIKKLKWFFSVVKNKVKNKESLNKVVKNKESSFLNLEVSFQNFLEELA